MKEKLLFVTRGGEDCDKGFSHVLELAKVLNAGVAVLMVYSKRAMESFEDVMAAAAFAEAGEFETAREILKEDAQPEEKIVKRSGRGYTSYLSQLGLIHTLADSTVKILKTTSFAIMALTLLIGASIVLKAMWQGRRAEKLLHAGGLEHGKV